MLTTDPDKVPHPEEHLGAYALDILDQVEALRVESHLKECFQCPESVTRLRAIGAVLGQTVAHRSPPPSLQNRIMGALPRAEGRAAPPVLAAAGTRPRFWRARMLVPLAAVVVASLLTFNLVSNLRLDARLDDLQRENAKLNRMVVLPPKESQFLDSLQKLKDSYWLADSDSTPMILEPPGKTGKSQGVLLVADDGRQAMLMVTGMRVLTPPLSYQVWLERQGQRLWVGQLKVDSRGWGTVTLHPLEPLFGFDTVQLTADAAGAGGAGPGGMVLEGHIVAQKLPK